MWRDGREKQNLGKCRSRRGAELEGAPGGGEMKTVGQARTKTPEDLDKVIA